MSCAIYAIGYVVLFSLVLRKEAATASCPNVPKCDCSKIKPSSKHSQTGAEEYKLKCSKIENLADLSLSDTNLTNVHHLDLSNNGIAVIHPRSFPLPDLLKLDLDSNGINHIEKGAFVGLVNLRTLNLSKNNITTLSREMFEGLTALETLKLNQNFITTISNGTFSEMKSLSKLGINGNLLVCDCNLYWLRISNIKLMASPKCSYPPGFTFEKLDKSQCDVQRKDPTQILDIRPAENQIVFEGDSLHLSCKVIDSRLMEDEGSVVQWLWNDQDPAILFRDDIKRTSPLGNSLIIQHLSMSHSGDWNCRLLSTYFNYSSTVNILVITGETNFCNAVVTKDNKGVYSWPQTVSNHKVSLLCQMNQNNNSNNDFPVFATNFCTETGSWSALNTNECSYVSSVTRILQQFSKMNLTSHPAILVESATRLSNFTSENLANMNDPVDLLYITITLENYLQFLPKYTELGEILMKIISHVLKFPSVTFQESQREIGMCSRFLNVLESITRYTPSLEFQNTEIAVKGFDVSPESFSGLTCTWFKNPSYYLNCSDSNRTTLSKTLNVEASVQVPVNLFDIDIPRTLNHRIMIAILKDNFLFPEKNVNSKYSVSSPIVCAILLGSKPGKQDDPVYIILKNYHVGINGHLAWWDADTGLWIKEGCRNLPTYAGNAGDPALLIFECYRLGYFALLSERSKFSLRQELELPMVFYKFERLHPFIYIGSFVCATSLLILSFIYIILYSSIQMSRKMKHSKINTWISTSLFCLTYCIGIWQTDEEISCQIIGLSIHYFALSTFFWMAVTIKMLYNCVQKSNPSTMSTAVSEDIGDVAIRRPIFGIYFVGWVISLMLCGISAGVNLQGYAAGPDYCFLTPGPALSTVLIPTSLVLFYLLIMCLLVNCATHSLDSNPQLSVGTQAIDLEILDAGRVSLTTHEHSSIRSVTTPSSQLEDIHHPPSDQLKIFVVYLILYILTLIAAASCVMLPPHGSSQVATEKLYPFLYCLTAIGLSVIEFACYYFHRSDIRMAICKFREKNFLLCSPKFRRVVYRDDPVIMQQTDPTIIFNGGLVESNNSIKSDPKTSVIAGGRGAGPLLKLHRQHYYRNNILNPANFYNPQQSIVAKKFFKKQRRKQNNILIRKCRSGGSSPIMFDRPDDRMTTERIKKFCCKSDQIFLPPGSGSAVAGRVEGGIPEYEEVPTNTEDSSVKYDQVYDGKYNRVYQNGLDGKRMTREQICGTSDKDWCSYDTVSDVNSEPTYNYAFIDKCCNNSTKSIILSDHSSSTSHLYATVAPDIITPPIAKCRNYQYVRNPTNHHNVTFPPAAQPRNNFIFSSGPNSLMKNNDNNKKNKKESNSTKFQQKNQNSNLVDSNREDKVETCL